MLETTDLVVVGLRALAFIAVVQAAGFALFIAIFDSRFLNSIQIQQSAVAKAALAAIVLVALQHAVEPARFTASFSGIFDGSLQRILLQSDAGAARAVRILGLAAIAWGALSRSEFRGHLMLAGAVIALCSFFLMGHTASHPERWLLAALLVIHLLVIAFWFGALLAFVVAGKREQLVAYGAVVKRFSVIAAWLVPCILIAGLAMAVVLMPTFASLATPYGALLMAKLAAFGLLMLLASWNRFRLAPRLLEADAQALTSFRRVVMAEWSVIALVLAITATMTSLFGPE